MPNFLQAFPLALAIVTVPASAALPVPPMTRAPAEAQAFLFYAGASDVFEITSSMIAIEKSQNPQVRAFASMLIEHHTQTTNQALAAAKGAGLMPPPPELTPAQKAQIGQLMAANGPDFDRLYLQQQRPAHQQALTLMQGYARSGDTPALRSTAQATIPIIQSHIAEVQRMKARR